MSKVLFVATVVRAHINTFHLPFLKWFKEQGWETHVAARNDFPEKSCIIPNCDKHFDIPFSRAPFRAANIAAYGQLKKLIDRNSYEIIHCHTPVGGVLTRLAARTARTRGTKVIYTAHGFHFYKGAPVLNWMLYFPIERCCAGFTDVLITINREDYELARNTMGAKAVEYLPGVGIDISKFSMDPNVRALKRKELGISEDTIMLLSVGELNRNKNHKAVIEALAECSFETSVFTIAGAGPLAAELTELADRLGLRDRVHFLGYRTDVPQLCKAADIFCFPSFREGLPVSLLQAMASGLPVICSKIRGNTDLIISGEGGFLFEPHDEHSLALCLEKLCEDRLLRLRMGKANLAGAQEFSLEVVLHKMQAIYGSLFSPAPGVHDDEIEHHPGEQVLQTGTTHSAAVQLGK